MTSSPGEPRSRRVLRAARRIRFRTRGGSGVTWRIADAVLIGPGSHQRDPPSERSRPGGAGVLPLASAFTARSVETTREAGPRAPLSHRQSRERPPEIRLTDSPAGTFSSFRSSQTASAGVSRHPDCRLVGDFACGVRSGSSCHSAPASSPRARGRDQRRQRTFRRSGPAGGAG